MPRPPTIICTVALWMLAIPAFCAGAGANGRPPLTVSIDAPIEYRNARGDRLHARYGRLSDDSLHFVKITLPDGKEYTLPLALSASGARYTNERDLVWWEHQGKARVEVRSPNGEWTIKYEGLAPADRLR